MARGQLSPFLRQLRRLVGPTTAGGLTDAQLLERFVAGRDEAAFEVLVWRHGTLVWNVCRRLLRAEHDAEDAFQATFLTLVRKARSIGKRQAVGSWLYKVAYRVALRARAGAVKRTVQSLEFDVPDRDAEVTDWRELHALLDEEVQRLPEKYRMPFLLCQLEGKSIEEAARCLGCPLGTVGTRLARARQRLRGQLARRGLTLTGGVLATLLSEKVLPAALVATTVRAGLSFATNKVATAGVVSGKVLTLTEGVLHTMFLSKMKTAVFVLLAVGVIGAGASLLTFHALAEEPKKAEPPKAADVDLSDIPALRKARLEAVGKAFEEVLAGFRSGAKDVESVYRWSLRWLEIEKEMKPGKEGEVAALEAHMLRMKALVTYSAEHGVILYQNIPDGTVPIAPGQKKNPEPVKKNDQPQYEVPVVGNAGWGSNVSAEAEYYRAEAALWLGQAKAK
jgi:RNA polymerase sigma factor (sigma-70 family)